MTRSASAIDRAYAPRFCSSFEQRMFVEYGDKGGILAGPVHAAHVDAGRRFDLVHIPADALDVADGLYRAVDWLNAAESFIDGAAGVPYHQAEAAMEVVLGAYLTKAQLTELIELCHQWNEAPSVSLKSLRDEDREDVIKALEAEAAEAAALAAAIEADARAAEAAEAGDEDVWDVLVTLAWEHAARMADEGRPWRDGADPVLEFRGITLFDRFAATVGDQTGPLGAEDWGDLIQEYRDAYWARLDALEDERRQGPPAGYR